YKVRSPAALSLLLFFLTSHYFQNFSNTHPSRAFQQWFSARGEHAPPVHRILLLRSTCTVAADISLHTRNRGSNLLLRAIRRPREATDALSPALASPPTTTTT
ncbi:hypothetical protein BZA70DRAFT_281168, partial [Myxozyma melibiosi]